MPTRIHQRPHRVALMSAVADRGDVVDAHAPESPTRFAKKLAQLLRGRWLDTTRPSELAELFTVVAAKAGVSAATVQRVWAAHRGPARIMLVCAER